MKKPSLYLDTTVWNFCFADDAPLQRDYTLEFFNKARTGAFELFYSDVVASELEAAPEPRRGLARGLIAELEPKLLPTSSEVERLAAAYLAKGVLPAGSLADAYHVAYASVHQMDILLSWNFRHLANVSRRNRVAALNLDEGYGHPLNLVTPLEVLNNELD